MEQNNSILFSEFNLGPIALKNRVVMAPMTRCRAIGNVPNELMVKYYTDRANAGLIITEGTSPSPNGLGYARIPGLYSEAQIAGWKAITDSVHAAGGKIFVQLMHTGRMSHSANLPEGAEVVSASAIVAAGQMWTDTQGMQPNTTPRAIATEEIPALIAEFVHSAKAAVEAGFDGVEIHAANGYLPMQLLNKASNQRTDAYGGNPENRNRFVIELAEAMIAAIGAEKVGIRLSPYNKYNDMTPDDHESEQYLALTKGLKKAGVCYIHLLAFAMPAELITAMHHEYGGPVIMNGGYTADRAAADLNAGKCELISFGSSYIANPDLVARMEKGLEITKPDMNTFYTPGAVGYNDYPVAG